MDFINSLEVRQLMEEYPKESFGIFMIAMMTVVLVVYCLASFRLFSITNEHHHHHYHPASPKHPLDDLRPGYYFLDERGRVTPAQTATPQPATRPRSALDESQFWKVFDDFDKVNDLIRETSAPVVPSTTRKRAKMSRGKRFRILRRDGFRCKMCGRGPDDAEGIILHVDHKMPLAKGGTDEDENLWTLCNECNGAKSDTIMEELFDTPAESDGDE
jgi:hypothetical protein